MSLLQNNPIDPQLKRFCGNVGHDDFADSSTWADDVRDRVPATAPWHFIDIPRGASRDQVTQACGAEGCVLQAIPQQVTVLKDKNADGTKRADALRFIIHFVGDLHQPLHATTNGDSGADCVPLGYFGRHPHVHNNSYSPNLHHIWDTEIIERHMAGAEPSELAASLDADFADSIPAWQQAGVQLEDWAWESHDHAEETTYGALPKKIPVEPANVTVHTCADNHDIGSRMLHKHIVVGQTYEEEAVPVILERLAQAGTRLAMMLNDAAK